MIDSIYTGITGVRSHQVRMSVISNNVANINTTAYKAGRVSFSDVMSKTLSEGAAARNRIAPTNPRQSGLGVEVSSIDMIQSQGSLQTTGIDTDLAIEGEGLFIVSDGTRDFYTRDGTFTFDVDGRLVDPSTGLVVKGHFAKEETGAATAAEGPQFGAELNELVIPLNRESKARDTTRVTLAGNLDASGGGERVWNEDTAFGVPARHEGLQSSQLTNFNTQLATGDTKLKITVTEGGTVSEGTISVPVMQYDSIAELRDQMNVLINSDDTLRGKVILKQELVGGAAAAATGLVMRTIGGGEDVTLTIDDVGSPTVLFSSLLGFTPKDEAKGASAKILTTGGQSTPLNQLANVGRDLTTGDILRFTGVKPGGLRYEGELAFDTAQPGTLKDLFAVVEGAYGGVTAGLDPATGALILTQNENQAAGIAAGDRIVGFDITFSLLDKRTTDPELGSGLLGDDPGFQFSTNTQVFDEQGQAHSLTFAFNKGLVENEWNWVATVDGYRPVAGNVESAKFLPDGTIDSFEATDGTNLTFAPSNGASNLSIEINATDASGTFGGLTQFVAPSSAAVRDQDGRASGSLVSVSIEENGHIRGLFDNGDTQVFGRVPLAVFGNPGGLRREGGNLLVETIASGTRRVGGAAEEIQGSVRSGSVEMSNVDLAEEFTNMIVTQRGFQASARSISTADELLAELVNLKR